MLNENTDYQFLLRVIKNEVSSAEREEFESWLMESDENKEKFSDILLIWEKAGEFSTPPPPSSKAQWELIRNSISEETTTKIYNINSSRAKTTATPNLYKIKTNHNRNRYHSLVGMIAKIAAVLFITIAAVYLVNNQLQKPTVSLVKSEATADPYVWETSKGEKATVPLGDGSIVYLNAYSRLIYPQSFSESERVIELRGEAYFVVAEDKSRPFRVITDNIVTEAVGTEFNIRKRNEKIQIVVANGRVKSYRQNQPDEVNLVKGELLTFTYREGFSNPKKVDISNYIAWRKNKLSFINTTLTEVMKEIEIYYNVTTQIVNKDANQKRLTGVFQADSLDDVLTAISISMNVHIKRNGKKIIVE
jgi:ferric-dicitrate binding protein FerR (iron transport regulator)